MRLMPGVRETNELMQASRIRKPIGLTSRFGAGVYGTASVPDIGRDLRFDAVMRHLVNINPAMAGAASTVGQEQKPKGPARKLKLPMFNY